jgi:hypothetical protein
MGGQVTINRSDLEQDKLKAWITETRLEAADMNPGGDARGCHLEHRGLNNDPA